jgi:stress response protein SCP2
MPKETEYIVVAVGLNSNNTTLKNSVRSMRLRFGYFAAEFDMDGYPLFDGNDPEHLDQVPISEFSDTAHSIALAVMVRGKGKDEWSVRVLDRHFDCNINELLQLSKEGLLLHDTPPPKPKPEVKPKDKPKDEKKDKKNDKPKEEPKAEPREEPKAEPKTEPKTEPEYEPKYEQEVEVDSVIFSFEFDDKDLELDAIATALNENGTILDEEMAYFGSETSPSGAMTLISPTEIEVFLDRLPPETQMVTFSVFSSENNIRLKNVDGLRLKVTDKKGSEYFNQTISVEFDVATLVIAAKLYKKDGEWQINTMDGEFDAGLRDLFELYEIPID